MHLSDISAVQSRPRVWLAVVAAAAALLVVSPMLVGVADADHVSCGDVITESTTLTHDVGPCFNSNGLILRGEGVTLDLGGHRVFAASPNGPLENVGIRIGRSSGVTVQNGTVEGFDAGVEIVGGSGNTVQNVHAVNNINDMTEPWRFESRQAPSEQPDVVEGNVSEMQWRMEMLCFYGDGITTTDSDNNVIRHNTVVGNGPYGGITLVGDSDGNRVETNQVHDNNISNWNTRADGSQGSALCGATLPGAPGMQRGRQTQAMGIRLEGPGADENTIEGNQVTDGALAGISIHSYVCTPAEGDPFGPQNPNEHNLITKNRVSSTGDERRVTADGFESTEQDDFADGISSMAQGPIGRVTCTSHNNTITDNTSMDNDRHGVSLHRTVEATEVSGNVANRNGGSGILVAEEAMNNTLHRNRGHQNAEFDGFDGNADCDNNDWMANRFKTVNQPCVAAGGTGWVGGPGKSGQAPGHTGDAGAANRGRPDSE